MVRDIKNRVAAYGIDVSRLKVTTPAAWNAELQAQTAMQMQAAQAEVLSSAAVTTMPNATSNASSVVPLSQETQLPPSEAASASACGGHGIVTAAVAAMAAALLAVGA